MKCTILLKRYRHNKGQDMEQDILKQIFQFSSAIKKVLVNNYKIKNRDNSFEKYVAYVISLYERLTIKSQV